MEMLQDIYGVDHSSRKETMTDEDNEDRLCVICLVNERNTTVLPCRHMCMCDECAQELRKQDHKCPICRVTVSFVSHSQGERRPPTYYMVTHGDCCEND